MAHTWFHKAFQWLGAMLLFGIGLGITATVAIGLFELVRYIWS